MIQSFISQIYASFSHGKAREHIILMLQSQIEEKQAAISDFRR